MPTISIVLPEPDLAGVFDPEPKFCIVVPISLTVLLVEEITLLTPVPKLAVESKIFDRLSHNVFCSVPAATLLL